MGELWQQLIIAKKHISTWINKICGKLTKTFRYFWSFCTKMCIVGAEKWIFGLCIRSVDKQRPYNVLHP